MPWLEFAGDLENLALSLPRAVAAPCCRYDALLPHQHSPRPKSATHLQRPPPNPAGNLVPARVGGKCPNSGSRASPLRVPPPWVYDQFLIWESWPPAEWRVLAALIPLPSGSPWLFRRPWLASGAEPRGYASPPGLYRLEAPDASRLRFQRATWVRMSLSHSTRHGLVQQGWVRACCLPPC
jgi:hypothetical protein